MCWLLLDALENMLLCFGQLWSLNRFKLFFPDSVLKEVIKHTYDELPEDSYYWQLQLPKSIEAYLGTYKEHKKKLTTDNCGMYVDIWSRIICVSLSSVSVVSDVWFVTDRHQVLVLLLSGGEWRHWSWSVAGAVCHVYCYLYQVSTLTSSVTSSPWLSGVSLSSSPSFLPTYAPSKTQESVKNGLKWFQKWEWKTAVISFSKSFLHFWHLNIR